MNLFKQIFWVLWKMGKEIANIKNQRSKWRTLTNK